MLQGSRVVDFTEFVTYSSASLYRTAWLLCGHREVAQDLVQEALARAYVRWARGQIPDDPVAYTRTILIRLFFRQKRRARLEILSAIVPDRGTSDERLSDISLALQAALDQQSSLDRTIVVLRYYCGFSVREVAAQLSLSESAVRSRASRATDKLSVALSDLMPTIAVHDTRS